MKKLFSLFLFACTLGSLTLRAQQPGTICNADFTVNILAGNQVQFTPLSINTSAVLQHRWYFGDGSAYSIAPAPLHTYQPGTYTVMHEVLYWSPNDSSLLVCSDSAMTVLTIPGSTTCNITTAFEFMRDSLQPNKVYFYNRSSGTQGNTRVRWNFGDGTVSDAQNPVHIFTSSGLFNVCLRVQDSVCNAEVCRPVQVQVPVGNCNLQAYYTSRPDSANPLKINFTNQTTGLINTDTIRWTFGDGSSSTALNPQHTYTQSGTYTVCLIIKRPQSAGTAPCVREYCRQVIVQPLNPCTLQVAFSSQPSTANPLTVLFNNLSTPLNAGDSIRWTFGDGSSSADMHPVHTYNQGGTYTVCLRVKKATNVPGTACVREWCQTITVVQPNPCNFQAAYSSMADSANPLKIHFTNLSAPLNNTDSIRWIFGDGSSSGELNPVHIYSQAGTYNVCLIIRRTQPAGTTPCVREVCRNLIVPAPQPCNLQVNFEMFRDSISAGPLQAWRFYNTSTPLSTTDSCFWNFGDNTPVLVTSGATPFVLHSFPAGGTYTVCLRVKKMLPGTTVAPCERQLCRNITIQQPSPCSLNAQFSWVADSANPRRIKFTNLSTPVSTAASVTWTFGDGSSSNAWNPVHEYTQAGPFNVCLRMVLNGTTCAADTCQVITLAPPPQDSCNIRPLFTSRVSTQNNQVMVFTNTSQVNSTNVYALWSFGDGSSATSWNAEHRYLQPGLYRVCLTLFAGNTCSRTYCDTIRVSGTVNPPAPVCDSLRLQFAYRRDAYMPNKLFFFALANQPLLRQQWTITRAGDSGSVVLNQRDPVYVFRDTGLYNVCLKGTTLNGCEKTHCREIRIQSTVLPTQCVLQAYPNPAHQQVSVNVQLDQPGPVYISVYNGQQILMQRITTQGVTGNNLLTVNVQQLPVGFYTMRIVYGNRVCYARFQKI